MHAYMNAISNHSGAGPFNPTTAIGDNATAASNTSPSRQAYRLLLLGFIAAPILAGLDKFFHLLVNWDQ